MHSSLQNVLDRINGNMQDELHDRAPVTDDERRVITEALTNVAHYVVDDRIVKLAQSPKVEASMRALVKAGIRQLPFDPMLIELPDLTNGRAFVRLQTHPMQPEFAAPGTDIYAYVYCTTIVSSGFLILSFRPGVPLYVRWDDEGDMGFMVAVHAKYEPSDEARAAEHIGMTAVAAMLCAMFMLNTRGVVTERITHEKLNKHRKAKGKAPIRDYTVVRVGHIYDSSGTAHSVDGSGRHMPVHWRSAHVRNVRYGPYSEPAKHRPVFIPACLVNFESEDEFIPLPKKEVVM